MGLFDRFKKKKESPATDYERISALGDNPCAWDELDEGELEQLVMVKCIEYGITQDTSRITDLFALYRHAIERLDVSKRTALLTQFSAMTEQQNGKGHMGLMMFLAVDNHPAIRSSAALSLSVLFDPQGGDELAGPKFVVNTLLHHDKDAEGQGYALGGVLLLGDKRVMPLLEAAWNQLSDDARLELTKAKSGFVTEGITEFWLNCLEKGCSESVFGSIVAAIAKLPTIADVPFVVDVKRVLPAYLDSKNPMKLIRRTSFEDYLNEIRPRLEALVAIESEPKLIPKIYEVWENPEQFKGMIG